MLPWIAAAAVLGASDCGSNPPFYSYHVHALYWGHNTTSAANAEALRGALVSSTWSAPIENCTADGSALIYPGKPAGSGMRPCFGGDVKGPIGPFLTAQWYMGIGLDDFGKVMPWLMRHHADYPLVDVFVHPVSGCDTQDHLLRSVWMGNRWQLDPSGLACDKVGCDGDAAKHSCTDHCHPPPPERSRPDASRHVKVV